MRKINVFKFSVLVVCLVFLGINSMAFATPSGEEVLGNVDRAMTTDSKIMKQKMTLVAANGQERTRDLQMWNKKTEAGDQMLARFLAPADVRGTGILMSADDMWLYLPALGRVRRVAAHAKKGNFMGSDLSYDDLEQLSTKGFSREYLPKLLGEEELNGIATYLLKLNPLSEDGDYSYLKMWVDKSVWLPRQIEYYDLDEKLLKVLHTMDLMEVDERFVAGQMVMEDQQKGTKTILNVLEVSFDAVIEDSMFTTRSLERGL